MRNPLFDPLAPKQTVSVTLNSDLYAKAKSMGINASKVAEEAVADEYSVRLAAELTAEIRQDVLAAEKYIHEHGSFSDFVKEHYKALDEDGAV
jgi:post-segregation antitoxin (ccd killing protein)